MASRFGRRQKRRMRAEIESTKTANTALYADLRVSRNNYDRLSRIVRDWDQEIRHLLSKHTALAIEDAAFRLDANGVRQLPVFKPLDVAVGPYYDMPESLHYQVTRLVRLVTDMSEEDLMQMRRLIRVRLKSGDDYMDESAAYAISLDMWRAMKGAPPEAQRRLVHETAEHIAEDMIRLLLRRPEPPRRYTRGPPNTGWAV